MQEKQTRRQAQAQESRKKIMEAALQLFSENGYEKTSVHMICQHLGAAASLLYHYFPGGKKELLQALLQEHLLALLLELNARKVHLEDLPIGDMLEQLYQDIEEIVMRHAEILRIVLREGIIQEMALGNALEEMIHIRHAWFASLLEKQAEKGEIAPMDYASAAETLDSLMLFHLGMELMALPHARLSNPERRKQLMDYQIGLWKRNVPQK